MPANETDSLSESDVVDLLIDDLRCERDDDEPSELALRVRDIRSFADAGVLTRNAGIVVMLEDGSEFQVTVVRSRAGR